MSESVDYAVFYEMLSNLAKRGETATLFLKTDTNHLAIIGVRAGRIVSFACGPKHGIPAIEIVRQANSGTVRVDQGAVSYHEQELPSTREVLELLSPFAAAQGGVSGVSSRVTQQSGATTASEQAQILCELLTKYIGPVAPIVCQEKIVSRDDLSGRDTLNAVIHDLAREIENPDEASEFIRRAEDAVYPDSAPRGSDTAVIEQMEFSVSSILDIKDRLCDLLTNYLGPAAPLVCEENIALLDNDVNRQELEKLIARIAEEIGDTEEAKEFTSAAWEQIAAISK